MDRVSPLQIMKNAYQEALKLKPDDMMVVDYYVSILTSAMHHKMTEPVWGWIIGPPSSCKTEVVRSMDGYDTCKFLSSMTENGLISGFTDEAGLDPSLITDLDKKVLVIKDFTAMSSHNQRAVNKILGDLRDAYDGSCSKASGRAGLRSYKAKFGVCAASTDSIDAFSEEHQQLGERFLGFRVNRLATTYKERYAVLEHVKNSMKDKDVWRNDLRALMWLQIDAIKKRCMEDDPPELGEEYLHKVIIMADLLAMLRTSCVGGTAVQPELGARVLQQLINLGSARATADGRNEWNDGDLCLVKRVVMDTLHVSRRRLIMSLASRGLHRPAMSMNQIATKCRTSIGRLESIVRQYIHTGIMEHAGGSGDNALYRMTQDVFDEVGESTLFEPGPHMPG